MDAVATGHGLDDPRTAPARLPTLHLEAASAERIVSPVLAHLERLHARHASDHSGALASYIPELAKADPSSFGICVATIGGAVYEVGDTRQAFTLQSISKPLTYGLALADHGEGAVRARIGVEPTGDAFNAIALSPGSGIPFNPMVNAGAIAAAGLVGASVGRTPFDRIADSYAAWAGRPLAVDESVYRSERDTGHRNRAIAHLLRSTGALDGDPDEAVDRYFRQCSVTVDARDLALMGATLAAGGRHPLTGVRVAEPSVVRAMLSVMATCGMYDGAGEWLFDIGLPAKSGVSGGILAVLPGQLGIAVFSPPLDPRGNSVRGRGRLPRARRRNWTCTSSRTAARAASRSGPGRTFGPADPPGFARPCRRLASSAPAPTSWSWSSRASSRSSSPKRSPGPWRSVRRSRGSCSSTCAGSVGWIAGPDRCSTGWRPHWRRPAASSCWPGAPRPWHGCRARAPRRPRRSCASRTSTPRSSGPKTASWVCADRDAAIVPAIALAEHDLVAGLDPAAVERLRGYLDCRRWRAGEIVVRRGDPTDELFLLTSGEATASVDLAGGGRRRLSTIGAGSVMGELAFLGGERRTADVVADLPLEAFVLTRDAFDDLGRDDPALKAAVLENLLRMVVRVARRMTEEVAALAG